MTNMHEPTPEFERFLEWQVTAALRRQDRFSEPARTGYRKYLAAAALVVVSMLAGAAGVTAAGQIQASQQKQLLLDQLQGELQLAELRVAIAETAVEDARKRAAVGVIPQAEVAEAERALQSAYLGLQRVTLNAEEVHRSGQPAQDEVTSPLVDGRDFVAERLQLDQKRVAMVAESATAAVKALKARQAVGLSDELELIEVEAEAAEALSDLRVVQERLALRKRFLEGRVSVAEATRQSVLLAARHQLLVAQTALAGASKRLIRLQSQFEVGVAAEVDVLKARLEVLSRTQDVTTLLARIQVLERGG
jgi:outer membrane protein TolC